MSPAIVLAAVVFAFILYTIPSYAAENEQVRIAIIDTGISSTAINRNNISSGRNYIMPNHTTSDTIGHGTAIATIIVGSEPARVNGICPEAILVPLVYYGRNENGGIVKGDCTMLARIIRDAVKIFGCRILNVSSGARVDCNVLREAVDWAEKKGALVISSAGNDGNDTIYYPSAYASVLCVGSANMFNSGPADFSNYHESVELLAPGEMIPVATMNGIRLLASGTSFSTAYTAGVAAKLMTEFPDLTAAQVRHILYASAKYGGLSSCDNSQLGIVSLEQALAYARKYRLFRWSHQKSNVVI